MSIADTTASDRGRVGAALASIGLSSFAILASVVGFAAGTGDAAQLATHMLGGAKVLTALGTALLLFALYRREERAWVVMAMALDTPPLAFVALILLAH